MTKERHEFTWNGIRIEILYRPDASPAFRNHTGHALAHLEIRSLAPEREPLPITGELPLPSETPAERLVIRENVLDIENYLVAADVGIYTSETETFGLGILESMNFGHPVLATNAGGIPEVVMKGKTGYLYEVGDITSFTSGVMRLAKDKALRTRMGTAGKKRAKDSFGPKRIVEEYIAFYRRILETDHC